MHEVVVISGKGGAGKTSVTGALLHAAGPAVVADLDVDAPDLHLLLAPRILSSREFVSGHEAVVDPERCSGCGRCIEVCRFEAVRSERGLMQVDPVRCEGCKVCVEMCPEGAVDFRPRVCGRWHRSETRFGPMVHALLRPGEENSGKLVSLLRQEARRLAAARGIDLVLCDGAPGIGCPVISSLGGASLAVAVTESTVSGRHDLMRVADLCGHFRVPVAVFINKFDLNADETGRIEALCRERGYPVVGRFPHHKGITRAMIRGQVAGEHDPCALGQPFARAWESISRLLSENRHQTTTREKQ